METAINVVALKSAMMRKGYGSSELCEEAGVNRNTLINTVKRGYCRIATAGKLAKALNMKPEELMK